jgi:hypothetical protein
VSRVLARVLGRCIGLDVHLDFIEIAICEEGRVYSAGRVPSTPEGIKTLAESLLPSDRVALEVTGSSREIARLLEPHVKQVIVVSPGDTGISQARAKTDRLDARTLAKLLWTGELEAVWMAPEWIAPDAPAPRPPRPARTRPLPGQERAARRADALPERPPAGV